MSLNKHLTKIDTAIECLINMEHMVTNLAKSPEFMVKQKQHIRSNIDALKSLKHDLVEESVPSTPKRRCTG